MASGETRVYSSMPGVTAEQIGMAVVNFLRNEKNQEAEGYRTQTGYFIQSRSRTSGIVKAVGLGTATVIEIETNQFGEVSATAGAGKWSDKVGAAAVGAVVFLPLVATAAVGAVQQHQLTESIFNFIESYARSAQPEFNPNPSSGYQALKQIASQASITSTVITCSSCGAAVDANSAFCPSCGSRMDAGVSCSQCGAQIAEGTKFCSSCGARVAQGNTCPSCWTELQEGQRFCHNCGADTQV